MIKSFACKDTEKLFHREKAKKFPPDIWHRGLRRLRLLNRAKSLDILAKVPAYRFEKLSGDRKGQYSLRINL